MSARPAVDSEPAAPVDRAGGPAALRPASPDAAASRTALPASREPGGGMLLYESDDTEWVAPQVASTVRMQVTDLVAVATVEQSFENPTERVVDATYVFPLPEEAAVHSLRLRIGDRVIVGAVSERNEARARFERARAQGRKASLIEQERPNLFKTRVANIGPDELVEVELKYQHALSYRDGEFSLHFPSTIAPRYAPGGSELRASPPARPAGEAPPAPRAASPSAPGAAPSAEPSHSGARVEAAESISPPFTLGDDAPWFDLVVDLDAGVAIESVHSSSHRIVTRATGRTSMQVELQGGPTRADRDFRLRWRPRASASAQSAVFEETYGSERYVMRMVPPPAPAAAAPAMPGTTTFVIDTSGSMAGAPLEQARKSLEAGLSALRPADRFNVVAFDGRGRLLFPEARVVSAESLAQARRWLARLGAAGDTDILAALELALAPSGPPRLAAGGASAPALEQVVFVTDGAVDNEEELLGFLRGRVGARRLFTVGIGAAPNRYLLRRAAHFGRGSFTALASSAEVEAGMGALLAKLASPIATDLDVHLAGDPSADVQPAHLGDSYGGEPLLLIAKASSAATSVRVRGRQADQPFEITLPLADARPEAGLHRLWARKKIETLMDEAGGEAGEPARREAMALALRHRLAAKLTSLLAVDEMPSVSEPGTPVLIPLAVPAGNRMFGEPPPGANRGPFCRSSGAMSPAGAALARAAEPR